MNHTTREKSLDTAGQLLEAGNVEEAVSFMEEYIKNRELCEEAAILGGEAYMRKGDFPRAKALIEQGLAGYAKSYELLLMLGQVYEAEGRAEAAGLCYRYALFLCDKEDDRLSIQGHCKNFKENHPDLSLPKAAILLYLQKRPEWLAECVNTIKKYAPQDSCEIIVVIPQCFSDVCRNQEEGIRYMTVREDECLSEICNQAIDLTDSRTDILILPEETYFTPHSIFHMQLAAAARSSTGMISAALQRGAAKAGDAGRVSQAPWYEGRILLDHTAYYIRRELIKTCGWFDDAFHSLRYLMADLGFRALNRGFGLCQCSQGLIAAGSSFKPIKDSRDEECFYEKWNVHTSYSCFSRKELIRMIPDTADEDLCLLEVGCSCGATLLSLKERFPKARLYGIELDEGPARIARNFANVVTGNIENMEPSMEPGSVDYILFADVLEHLRDPLAVLKKMSLYLKPDGHIIASIPNVMHVSVVKPLLEGHWHYQDAGILDRTHLKFFTYAEILSMFEEAGYQTEHIMATGTGGITAQEEQFIQKAAELGNCPADLFKVYQFLILAGR